MNIQKQITPDIVTRTKVDKKGKSFISLRYNDKWLICYETKLFNIIKKGETYNVITDGNKEFEKLLDVVSDDVGVVPAYDDEPRPAYPDKITVQKNETIELLKEIRDFLEKILDNQNTLF